MSEIKEKMADLLPVSRVLFRAITESVSEKIYADTTIDFLKEAQAVWKGKKFGSECRNTGAIFLGYAFKYLESKSILNDDGKILDPVGFANSERLDGFLCRPHGFAPIDFGKTLAIKNLVVKPTTILTSRER